MTPVAAIDIGTNTTRLLISDAPGESIVREEHFTRLGQGVNRTRSLHPDAVSRTVDVLRGMRKQLDAHHVEVFRAVATSAARDAENADDFFAHAAEILGRSVELISGDEEAALGFVGATFAAPGPAPYLVIDVGGGSTEFAYGVDKPSATVSIDVGSVRLTEQLLHGDPLLPEELSMAFDVVRGYLADVSMAISQNANTCIGLAGTITTMAAIDVGLREYSFGALHHVRLTRNAAEEVFRTLATETLEQRKHNPGLPPERADVIVGGAVVVCGIMRHFELNELVVSEIDLLDGIVAGLANTEVKKNDPM